jgi:hypothetical protein
MAESAVAIAVGMAVAHTGFTFGEGEDVNPKPRTPNSRQLESLSTLLASNEPSPPLRSSPQLTIMLFASTLIAITFLVTESHEVFVESVETVLVYVAPEAGSVNVNL